MKPDANVAAKPNGAVTSKEPTATAVDGMQAVILSQPSTAVSSSLPKGERSLMPAVALLTTFVGLVCAGTLAYALLRPTPQVVQRYCDSDDCFQHAYMLVLDLNRSADPCADFGEYVCSAWPTTSIYSFNTQQDRWHKWIQESAQLLGSLRVRRGNKAIAKALQLFRLCLKMDAVALQDNFRLLQQFVSDRKLVAPADGTPSAAHQPGVHPLDVLLDLAINWQMPFWFDVRFLRTNGSHLGILIRPGHYEVFWEIAVEKFIMEPLGTQYEDGGDAPRASITNATSSFFVDSAILSELRNVASGPPKSQPVAVRIKEISSVTPSVTSEQWLEFLRKHLAPTFVVTGEDQILLQDEELLVTVNRLLEKYEHEHILTHIARLVNRTFGNVFSKRLQSLPYDDVASLSPLTNVSYACEVQVEDTFRLPIATQRIAKRKLNLYRAAIDDLLGDVMRATISLLRSSTWMDAESKQAAIKRIQDTTIQLWPREQLIHDEDALYSLYEKFPSGSKIYFDELLLVRKATRAVLGTPAYADIMWMPHGGRDPYFAYDAFSNSIHLAMGAVMPSLFYASATKSINYAGAAALLAPLVVSVLNASSVALDANGWTVKRGEPFPARPPCSADVGDRSAYPDVAAIEVAYRAYKDSLERDGLSSDVRVRPFEEFTGEQLFFMSVCRNTCQLQRGTKTSKTCNAALRDFEPFAAAFGCPKGSFMNPDKKCGFFH
ncbi:neprilysin [Dermacentor silvarum]|uniref:neprilysin n=1 Tax=Dermacentor silvarum TaxID=543639 RepID=UPI00189C06D4|nr:neprilysin [Dermacentor silvarum]